MRDLRSAVNLNETAPKVIMTNTRSITPHSAEETRQLELLRQHRKAHRQKNELTTALAVEAIALPSQATRGERLADIVASTVGSWRFIVLQSTAIVFWITSNALTGTHAWDPFPFILLNLLLSFQAAYTAPAIMMSQNRQSEMDRRHAQSDYAINVKAELEIELLHQKIDLLKAQELLELTQAVRELSSQVKVLSQKYDR
jgi:uncharacterized membrane protein